MKIAGLTISNPEKVLFPGAKITKLDIIRHYEDVADKMLPFLKDRPLTLHRFPDGINGDGFYQKNAADYFPKFIKRITVKTEEGENTQIICNTMKSLIYLANQGTISFHIWLSKIDKIEKPDKVVFDLDPSKDSFIKLKEAAEITRRFLQKKGKNPALMTTGQNGLHVWYTMRRTKTYDELRPELKEWAVELESENPDLFTTAVRKNKREGKIFIDYLRNAYAQTSVCPYSLRPNKSAGIAMPIEWKDLKNITRADQFSLKSLNN